jgi:exopolysaccharide biosynthesis polyprenyl glycosylphosphotransferase
VIWGFPLDTDRIQDVPIVTVANHRIDVQTGWLKRCEDLAIGSCMLVALAPLLVAVAILVRLDSRGPVLFRQKRLGFNNQIFEVYKFRSMTVDRPADDGAVQATKSDKRITRVGRFIRRTSLDELPQLFNVIEGTMSLVGPRPHALPHNHQFGDIVDEYFARHNVKPGITGWAQIHGFRGETDVPEKMSNRVRCDIHYIQNWSILLDMKIIVLTALRVWSQKTAY